ncbi:hypothetical protein ACSAGD_10650 [Paramicrobacterium sp. CJ85]|uniref:hypothetical protein n=1 Tax=Paramicrobacterium sp. CJ85 TaxID=3445355 RepID=UPI003F61654F
MARGVSQSPAQKRAMEKIMQDAARKLQPQANATVQDVIRGVDDSMRGQPVADVQKELERRLVRLGMRPSPGLAEYAQAISDGDLKR